MSDKRIIEYDTANALADDDYILLDSETGGTCKIKAKKLQPPLPNRITATYTQTITVKDTDSLDVLRQDLIVKAYYDDGVVETVSNYTLSGTLTVGTSTITASYKGKSDSFDVTVETSIVYLYNWDFTQSLIDSVNNAEATIYGTATQDSTGLHFTSTSTGAQMVNLDLTGKTVEVDISSMDMQKSTFFLITNSNQESRSSSYNECGALRYDGSSNGWRLMLYTSSSGTQKGLQAWNITNDKNLFNGKTIKIEYAQNTIKLYADDVLLDTQTGKYYQPTRNKYLFLGDVKNTDSSLYNKTYNITFTGLRIYETPTGGN